jgi:uncharacterized repeat protein (TIGR01451 family)
VVDAGRTDEPTRTRRETDHWRGVVVVALLAGATGLFFERPLLLLAACVGVGYALYPRLDSDPATTLTLERRLSERDPAAGDTVTVTVTVTNDGDRWIPDLRVVDGVPALLSVTDGTARHAASLGAGGSTVFSYEVTATRGTHQFRPATAVVRNLSGAVEIETTVAADDDRIECVADVGTPPVTATARSLPGRVHTDESGEGLEFDRTRRYRRGDDPTQIDWKRFARTGRLTTIRYRREQTVSVVACVDARQAAYRGVSDAPHAVSVGVAATEAVLESVWGIDERAGLAAVGRELCWVPPGRGDADADSVRQVLLTHPTLAPQPPDDETTEALDDQIAELRARLTGPTQLVIVSPLPDGEMAASALELAAAGRTVTVVSPDVTATDSPGGRLAAVERRNRIHRLRRSDVRVVDWNPDEPVSRAIQRARRRWGR